MNTCIKCGRPIEDGELFCAICARNPAAHHTARPAQVQENAGRMLKPIRPPRKAPAPVKAQPAQKKHRAGGTVIAALCVFMGLSLALNIYLVARSASSRVSLRLRESDLEQREQYLASLEQSLQELETSLLTAEEKIGAQEQTITELEQSFSSAQSTVSQTQYDMTTREAELARITEEYETLKQENEALSQSVQTLTDANEELASSNRLFLTKTRFMDSYVVFVENDATGYYHKYDCEDFAQTSFWAYSRKLAEANGYKPCPHCFS